MAQQLKVLAVQAWQPEFQPQNPQGKERTNFQKLSSNTPPTTTYDMTCTQYLNLHAHTHAHMHIQFRKSPITQQNLHRRIEGRVWGGSSPGERSFQHIGLLVDLPHTKCKMKPLCFLLFFLLYQPKVFSLWLNCLEQNLVLWQLKTFYIVLLGYIVHSKNLVSMPRNKQLYAWAKRWKRPWKLTKMMG